MENQWIQVHIAGEEIYKAVTGHDVRLAHLSLMLRNSVEDVSANDANTGTDAHTALSLPAMNESEFRFHEEEVSKWTRAILDAARNQNWPVLDGRTLAPLTNPAEFDCAIVEVQRIADWIAARIPDPAIVEGICTALGQLPEKPHLKYAPSRHRQQEAAILGELKKRGYNPRALPVPQRGKSGVKKEIRDALRDMNTHVFDAAWERLRKCEDIADQ